jgi:hypothetical protein
MRIIGWLIAAVPVGFALLRAATTGTDFRYLWVAVVSIISAGTVVVLAPQATNGLRGRFVRAAAPFTWRRSGCSIRSGAGSVPAVLVVSLGFALCSGIGLSLAAQSRVG